MTAASLEVSGLSAGYGPTRILEEVSFAVPAGGRLAVLGRNGMGKTTLFATIAGQTRRYGGTVVLGGAELTGLDGSERARGGLGYVPQSRSLFKSLTVEENLFVGLKEGPKSAIEQAYAMFPRLKERRRNLGSQLSGGEQQMLPTARTILGQPTVLLLDEPLEGLTPVICEELMTAFSELAATKAMTILLVEQRAWMLGGTTPEGGLRLPADGVDERSVIEIVRRMATGMRSAYGVGSWMIVFDGEVVGLCSYKAPPDTDGVVEIGYGVAASRRERGHATRAIADLLTIAMQNRAIRRVVAETMIENPASQRVLERNGFVREGKRIDPEDGEVLIWRRDLSN